MRSANIFGFSSYSNTTEREGKTYADVRVVPHTYSQPSTSNTGTSVRISWVKPDDGGFPVTSVEVSVKASNGSFLTESANCNGITEPFCVVPMSVLIASPYNLQQGNKVIAMIRASNAIGFSAYSDTALIATKTYADI